MTRLLLILMLMAAPALAVQPDEVLDDPRLESRARAISRELRCPVCQGENIDDSNAAISRDLRLYVRERLVAGDSDAQVLNNVADRFGDVVLFKPRASGINLILWLAGPAAALIAVLAAWRFLRARGAATTMPKDLNAEERARLTRIMRDGGD